MKLRKLANAALVAFVLMPVTIASPITTPSAIAQSSTQSVANELQGALSELRQNTDLPILLPAKLPSDSEQLYVQQFADKSSYSVEIGYTPECSGSACFVGSFSASRESYGQEGDTITLAKGIKGYFLEVTCSHCGDSSLTWKQNGVSYQIRYKVQVETRKQVLNEMLRMANSAIKAGPR
ncbi:hypothetical protein RIVM261_013430 [Rivularia sp. IAM M-261]|nr:hypothetical protein RIVM261_013430 [Rivularia sp. IAM M-261]